MKIVVVGGSGLIGKKLVPILRKRGHEVVAASPSSGVNSVTGEGLAQALAGASVVVDVTNSPPWEDAAAHRRVRGTFPGRERGHPGGSGGPTGSLLWRGAGRPRTSPRRQSAYRPDTVRRVDRPHGAPGVNWRRRGIQPADTVPAAEHRPRVRAAGPGY